MNFELAKVDILLSVYNGEEYLPELLDSIAAQTFNGWKLIARDDGSSDGTSRVLEEFSRKYPGKCEIVPSPEGNLGIVRSFSACLQRSVAPFFMFCGHDDVWLDHKIQTFIDFIDRNNLDSDQAGVVLIHSDLTVVDASLKPKAVGHLPKSKIYRSSLSSILRDNVVTGCVTCGNAHLREAVFPIPPVAIFEDWWTAIVAGALGRVFFIDQATILYRQHGKNQAGSFFLARQRRKAWWHRPHWTIASRIREVKRRKVQAAALLERVKDIAPEAARKSISHFVRSPLIFEVPIYYAIKNGSTLWWRNRLHSQNQ